MVRHRANPPIGSAAHNVAVANQAALLQALLVRFAPFPPIQESSPDEFAVSCSKAEWVDLVEWVGVTRRTDTTLSCERPNTRRDLQRRGRTRPTRCPAASRTRGRVFRARTHRRPTTRAATGEVDAKRGIVDGEHGHPTSLPSGAPRRRPSRLLPDRVRTQPLCGPQMRPWPSGWVEGAGVAGSPQVDAEAVVDGGRFLEPVEAGGDLRDLFGEVLVADRFR